MERDDLKQYLGLIEREIENGKLAIEKQRLLIEEQPLSFEDHCQALEALERLRQALRDLENNRDELMTRLSEEPQLGTRKSS